VVSGMGRGSLNSRDQRKASAAEIGELCATVTPAGNHANGTHNVLVDLAHATNVGELLANRTADRETANREKPWCADLAKVTGTPLLGLGVAKAEILAKCFYERNSNSL
jgi:hypothetical protein